MADIIKKLLLLLNQEKTINEICLELNITNKELYNYLVILRNKGFNINRKYLYDGNILLSSIKNIDSNKDISIYTTKEDTSFKCVLISDLHLGNRKEKPIYLDMVFDYCIKEGINIIICGGDFVDGHIIGSGKKYFENGYEQIEYAIKRYPYDKNILTFIVLGNHDLNVLTETGQDLSEILYNYRPDIISTGYGIGTINVKNDHIYLRHELGIKQNPLPGNKALIIEGHSHRMGIKTSNQNLCIVSVPTLSNLLIGNYLPGFIKMNLDFYNGVFTKGILEQFIIYNKRIMPVNYNKVSMDSGKNTSALTVNYEYVKKIG